MIAILLALIAANVILLGGCAELRRVAPLERVDPDCPCKQVYGVANGCRGGLAT